METPFGQRTCAFNVTISVLFHLSNFSLVKEFLVAELNSFFTCCIAVFIFSAQVSTLVICKLLISLSQDCVFLFFLFRF